MTIKLDTNNPFANFTQEGGQAIIASATAVNFNDTSEVDKVVIFGSDGDAAKGKEVDLLVSFKVGAFIQDGADTGVRFVINNGQDQSAICACTIDTAGQRVVALAKGISFNQTDNYDAVVPVDWNGPTTLRLRRAANGDAEILEVNGVAPAVRALLPGSSLTAATRTGASIEVGCFGVKPIAVLDVFSLATVVRVGGVKLDPNNPFANFTQEGGQALTPSPTALNFNDTSEVDSVQLFASDPGATKGKALDLLVSFKVSAFIQDGADIGVRFIVNNGQDRAAVCACSIDGLGQRGVALAKGIAFNLPENYGAFVPVEWTAPTTVRLRRASNGDAEILEVNGVAPATRAMLTAGELASNTRTSPTVEFGTFGLKPIASLDVFSLETVVPESAEAGALTFTRFRLRDADSADRLAFRADFVLGSGSNGIDPTAEPVRVTLATPAGVFYSKTVSAFTVHGHAPRRSWRLDDAGRAASGIEQLVINEDSATEGSIFLRDRMVELPPGVDHGAVTAEVVIGSGLQLVG